jgi:hypothetical protein
MKIALAVIILLLTTVVSYSQQIDSLLQNKREERMVMSQKQNSGAWTLTAIGSIGLIATRSSFTQRCCKVRIWPCCACRWTRI